MMVAHLSHDAADNTEHQRHLLTIACNLNDGPHQVGTDRLIRNAPGLDQVLGRRECLRASISEQLLDTTAGTLRRDWIEDAVVKVEERHRERTSLATTAEYGHAEATHVGAGVDSI